MGDAPPANKRSIVQRFASNTPREMPVLTQQKARKFHELNSIALFNNAVLTQSRISQQINEIELQ
jgi:hypothetical protein